MEYIYDWEQFYNERLDHCSTTKTFLTHRPISNARFRSFDLRSFFSRDHMVTWTEKLRMGEKKTKKAQTTGFMQVCKIVFAAFSLSS